MSFDPSRIEANARKLCSEKGCTRTRAKGTVAARCDAHRRARKHHQISPRILKPFRAMAERFVKAHENDEQMVLALATLQELIEPGPEPPQRVSRRWHPPGGPARGNWSADYLVWKRLMLLKKPLLEPAHGGCKPGEKRPFRRRPPLTAREALPVILSVFLLTEMHQEFLKDDGRPLSVEVARHLYRMRPSGKSHTNSKTPSLLASATFGDRLRNSPVWLFMMKNLETIKAEDRARVERRQKMYEPMQPRVPERTKLPPTKKVAPPVPVETPTPTIGEPSPHDDQGISPLTARIRAMASARRGEIQALLARSRAEGAR